MTIYVYGQANVSRHLIDGVQDCDSLSVEIDEDLRVIRVKAGKGLPCKLGSLKSSTIGFSKHIIQKIMKIDGARRVIQLRKDEDGWWYGSW
ncbi:hypothetical protein [Klebsiella michiganensis]|uniref:hypothetical protein n=1 Tax=Klebsiella michiganensis TaxID=1134687 RepID=UPI00255AD9B5|nr:hypothetical protein [Klebsiella michiganensis]MDL4446311.1 hypothetical protein [Klebsiella michiganensis]MDL4490893.1 hypothetical protein [Klebsiella michiganensis]MDL4659636.1 hypothetical protein [Klebsiella michiganensis]